MILVDISGARAAVRKQDVLTGGMVGATVTFNFDEDWEGLAKTAVFRAGEVTKDALVVDSVSKIPHEVLIPGVALEIGVYGTKDDGDIVIPTVWAKTNLVKAGADPSGEESVDPSLPFWAELQERLEKNLKGEKGDKGDTGNSGVYVGSGDMPEDCNVQIDPNGDSFTIPELEKMRSHINLSNMIVNGANQAPHKTYEVLQTYLSNNNRLYYHNSPGIVAYRYSGGMFTPRPVYGKYENGESKFPIVCSTLAMLALQGVGFENCRINNGNITDVEVDNVLQPRLSGGENIPYAGCKTIDLTEKEMMDYWNNSEHGTVYSANMGKLFYDAGMLHKIKTSSFSEILPGDVLFYDNSENDPSPFLNIGHVEIFTGWDGVNIVSLCSDGSLNNPPVYHSRRSSDGPFVNNHLKYYARIPCAGEPGVAKQIGTPASSMPFVFSGNNLTVNTTEPLKRNRAYPVVVKFNIVPKIENNGDNPRLNIYGRQQDKEEYEILSQILIQNKGQNVAPNTYYTTLVIPESYESDVTSLVFNCVKGEENEAVETSAILESVSVYNTIVQQG